MQKTFRWRPGVLAAIAMTLLSLFPQAHLWYTRGHDWQGAYASFDGDEAAYAAYLAALIEGRPRLNDPYTGRDDAPGAPLAESLFSIQFFPPYALALPARAFNLKTTTVFIILTPLVAFMSSLALFWLLALLLEDERLAATGVVVILCLGVFASGQGTLFALAGRRTLPIFPPFLRRYVPGLPFPLLFLFCALVWRALVCGGASSRRTRLWSALAAGVLIALLVFSYFYLWTTAAAWLACLALLWFVAARGSLERRRAGEIFGAVGVLAALALAPYAFLLSRRAPSMDVVQALQMTHAPDLWRAPEIIGYAALLLLAYGVRRKILAWREPASIFAASFALTPLVVFNQQVMTGLSLQPVHYKVFTLNYFALLAFVLSVVLLRRRRHSSSSGDTAGGGVGRGEGAATTSTAAAAAVRSIPRWAIVCVLLAAYGVGLLDTFRATLMFEQTNLVRDRHLQATLRLADIASGATRTRPAATAAVVFVTNFIMADNLPIVAPQQAVLWAPHMLVGSGLTAAEHKERMYSFFYYAGVAENDFPQYLDANKFLYYALFGPARALPYLSSDHIPITNEEIAREQRSYATYVAAFDRERARQPLLSYVVASPGDKVEWSNLDRWYERDAGERVGDFTIYRVTLRP